MDSDAWGWRLAHLPVTLAVTGLAVAGAAVAGWLVAGGTGAAGAAAGVGVVAASYLVSTLLIAWADAVRPGLVLPVGLLTFAVKFPLIGVLFGAAAARDWAGLPAMVAGVVAGVVAWAGTQVWWVVRHPPRLAYAPPAEGAAGRESRSTPPGGAPHPGGGS